MSTLIDAIRAATLDRVQAPGAVDAIVIGAGATGGLCAQLLTEAGLRVLVLDAGMLPSDGPWWRRVGRRLQSRAMRAAAVERRRRQRQPVQSQCYAWVNGPEAFVDDVDCPYTTPADRPFLWFRSRQLGGRLAVRGHGRQYYRMSESDLHPADGLSPDWPLEPGELDPWYSLVESHIALTGRRDDNPFIPNSDLATTVDFTASERAQVDAIAARWPHARPMLARYAPPPRALDVAAKTKRLWVRTGAIVRQLAVDTSGRITGVAWIDQRSAGEGYAVAPLVFLCASALESTRLLLMSRSSRFPMGLGSSSSALGHFLMDHIRLRLRGRGPTLPDSSSLGDGRCIYIPRFDTRVSGGNRGRGFGVQIYNSPSSDGGSRFAASAYGEMLPRWENRVTLDESMVDAWGLPVLHIDCRHGSVDRACARAQVTGLEELAEALGIDVTEIETEPAPPGTANHECGTARMGTDPSSSVVDPHNECWDARGLYLADGACLPSQGMQNPTLTFLALAARACYHAMGARLSASGPGTMNLPYAAAAGQRPHRVTGSAHVAQWPSDGQ